MLVKRFIWEIKENEIYLNTDLYKICEEGRYEADGCQFHKTHDVILEF